MTTYVRATEAARLLGVSKATLYAYVSRGRVRRTTGPDGRVSLFALDEIEALASRGRRASPAPRPTIDVQIASAIATLSEDGVLLRGRPLPQLASESHFEDVAELLWSGDLPRGTRWETPDPDDTAVCERARDPGIRPISQLAIAAHLLAGRHPDDDAPTAARRLLVATPRLLGARRSTGSYAQRLTSAWRARPSTELVDTVDQTLILLADHGLATSTLAVRVAASARTSAYAAIAAGLAAVDGALHGSASALVHELLTACEHDGVDRTLAERRRVPGFGHKIYRRSDPRFAVLMDTVRDITPPARLAVVDELLRVVGRRIAQQPNIDLALGTLTWAHRLDPDVPIFAVARIAGWAAHCAEEFDAPPLRYRGLARQPV